MENASEAPTNTRCIVRMAELGGVWAFPTASMLDAGDAVAGGRERGS